MCPVVFAECSVGFVSSKDARAQFDSLRIVYDDFSPECAYIVNNAERIELGTRIL